MSTCSALRWKNSLTDFFLFSGFSLQRLFPPKNWPLHSKISKLHFGPNPSLVPSLPLDSSKCLVLNFLNLDLSISQWRPSSSLTLAPSPQPAGLWGCQCRLKWGKRNIKILQNVDKYSIFYHVSIDLGRKAARWIRCFFIASLKWFVNSHSWHTVKMFTDLEVLSRVW